MVKAQKSYPDILNKDNKCLGNRMKALHINEAYANKAKRIINDKIYEKSNPNKFHLKS